MLPDSPLKEIDGLFLTWKEKMDKFFGIPMRHIKSLRFLNPEFEFQLLNNDDKKWKLNPTVNLLFV